MIEAAIAELSTIRDLLRYAVSRFNAGNLVYGHGTTNAVDEASFIIMESLHLPSDALATMLDARVLTDERRVILELIEMRVSSRRPAAYLVGKAYIRGVPFFVDERVIVPRSFLAHMLRSGLVAGGKRALIRQPNKVRRVLDLCTGSGCIAILAASCFPGAVVDAVDLSGDALAVARRNVDQSGFAERVRLFRGNMFDPVAGKKYDLILSNPPYVSARDMVALPQEYLHEPQMALAGGMDGLDFVRVILQRARLHTSKSGGILCEIGTGATTLKREFPQFGFRWLESGAVFWLQPHASTRATIRSRTI
jgi:ribosomal protein L3 glutamine methyltransferase